MKINIAIARNLAVAGGPDSTDEEWRALRETGFYGHKGAGAIFYCTSTKRYLLALRSSDVEQPGTWGIWGGAIGREEDPIDGVRREVREEVGFDHTVNPILIYVFEKGTFRYYNFLVKVDKEFEPDLNWETEDFGWFPKNKFPKPLHFGVQALIKEKAI